jgi:hypothetical protein
VEKRCANARSCAREAKGRVWGLEKEVAASKQELAHQRRAWRSRRSSGMTVRRGGRGA